MPQLDFKDLKCEYMSDKSSVIAVDHVSFTLEKGEILGIVGESGSGKTTLALGIIGLLPGNTKISGKILFEGKDIASMQEYEKDRVRWKEIAMVFQNGLEVLNPVMKVGQQVCEPMIKHLRLSKKDAEARCVELFGMVGLDPVWMGAYPHQLSGGMRQRVLIAMALSCEPELLILDEVTSALDAFARKEIRDLLLDLQKKHGYSMVMISHDITFVSSMASRLMVLYSGRIVERGPTRDVVNSPRHPYTRGLINSTPDIFIYKDMWGIPGESSSGKHKGCPFYSRCTQPIDICLEAPPELKGYGGREVACHRGGIATLLKASCLAFNYYMPDGRKISAVDDVHMEVREGEVLAIVGQTGSGKSTLAHILAGVMKPENGDVFFKDAKLNGNGHSSKFGGVQIVFQDPFNSTSSRFTVLDAVKEPLDINNIGTHEERIEMAMDVLSLVRLPSTGEFLNKYCGELSGGQRQRVALARALIMRPKLLIADEITSALDVSTAANVLRLLKGLQNRRGFAMIYISHDLTLTLKIADRIAVMDTGKIIETGNAHDVMLSPHEDYTKRLVGSRIGLCCHDRH
ncbi:ABC transporter ATP-binding protein [Methanocella sp. CWC-04]|uniref:Nickel import system ATP-binding protein NikD n=1 Tax=Methanooceanicella nereidis TaxID=2052831 RepID=A0AAP2W6L6_9EURY|nr:ABC transporter ATP-binding protein [Methanocella sp. CWC-04]